MDNIKSSRERRRLNKNLENKNQSFFEPDKTTEYSFEINPPVLYPRNTSTPAKKVRSKYSNVKIVASDRNRNIEKDDTDDEEDSHELAATKQHIRRSSISPEGTDENSSDHDNITSKNPPSTAILHKREKRRKTKRKRTNQEKRFSSTRENNEENIDENWSTIKSRESTSPTRREYSDGNRRLKKKRTRGDTTIKLNK